MCLIQKFKKYKPFITTFMLYSSNPLTHVGLEEEFVFLGSYIYFCAIKGAYFSSDPTYSCWLQGKDV